MSKHLLWIVAVLLTLSSCSDGNDSPGVKKSNPEKVRIAVILPFDQNGTDWNRVLQWAKTNITEANDIVEPEFEIYDENLTDIDGIAAELAARDDLAAIIGCFHSSNTQKLAFKCAVRYKPVFTFSTSEELQRAFGPRGFLWCMAESDITQSELLLIKANMYGARTVSLLACDDIYGHTFVDWFAFQAGELGMQPAAAEQYADNDLEAKFGDVSATGADCIICAPASARDACRIVKAYRKSGFKGRLLFSDTANSPELISTLGAESNGVEGISMVADPTTGFSIAYEVEFGTRPSMGEAQVYDAVMTACYAARHSSIHGLTINESIAAMLNAKAEIKGMWTEGAMAQVFRDIEAGKTPAFSGASGNLDFSTDKYTSIQYSTYAHWMAYENEFIYLDYDMRSGHSGSSEYAAWEWNKQYMQQFDEDLPSLRYPDKTGNHAVVIAASRDWMNYRHQADALAVYHMLKDNGYDDDHITLIMADDIARNPANPEPGVIRHAEGGENLYRDVEIDYRLGDITPHDLKDILLGKTDNGLMSQSTDNVLLFWSGHGEKGRWLWDTDDTFDSAMLRETLTEMHREGKYRKMLCLIETCYSGSMGLAIEGIPGVLFITAANDRETSKADTYSTDLGVWMTNRFTTTLLSCISDNPGMPLRELYYRLFSHTLGSHVSVYNVENYGNIYKNSLEEFVGGH